MRKLQSHLKPWLFVFLILLAAAGLFLSKKNAYEWVFVYYMSYDNDLSSIGEGILSDLKEGIVNSNVAVVTQADFIDGKGMKRIALYRSFRKPKRKRISLKSEDSADPAELKKYLNWVKQNWRAKNYCIIFLNHGGTLNNMCLDKKPFRNPVKNKKFASGKWLSAAEAGKIIADFNQKTDGKVRLLFLQQCGRATIQNLYNFVDAAEFIMASPVKVGVPNTYYTNTLKYLANDPNMTGTTIAETIMQQDEDYTLYTLLDNNELKKLPEKIEPILKSFTTAKSLNPPQSCSQIFEYDDEKFYDLKNYLQALSSANNDIAGKELADFFDWSDNHLIVSKRLKNYMPLDESSRSGLAIYVPSDQNQTGRYNFLPLYKQTNLESLTKLTFRQQ